MAEPRRSSFGRRFALLAGVVVAAAVVAVLLIATSGSGTPAKTGTSPTTNSPPVRHAKPAVFNPASVTVAVLNGTPTYHLAHNIASRLADIGFKEGTIATASNQTLTSTIVAYRPHYYSDAVHVARELNLGPTAVQPVDQAALAVACPQPSPCTANVIVTVGSNLATL